MADQPEPPPPYSLYPESPGSSDQPGPPPLPPPLPPRNPSTVTSSSSTAAPPLNHVYSSTPTSLLHDPRSSSQASLTPNTPPPCRNSRRTLLLIYIHGFMGNETSFQSFPAHLHNLLTLTLGAGTDDDPGYLVHTKVYPKFQTRHQISVATLEFSRWLSQFESPTTDIILLGHSMGGILAAEVIVLPSPDHYGSLRHPGILGLIAFDTPFLGMHPGVVSSGIASLFRPAPPSAATPEANGTLDPLISARPERNFTIIPSKTAGSALDAAWGFVAKHKDNITSATGKYLMSHLEFGACLGDPIGLKRRYDKIRKLEDGDWDEVNGRVRFANYYTISYGIGKKPKPMSEVAAPAANEEQKEMLDEVNAAELCTEAESALSASIARLAVQDASGDHKRSLSAASGSSLGSMQELFPEPLGTPELSPTSGAQPPLPGFDASSEPPTQLLPGHIPELQESPSLLSQESASLLPPLPPPPVPPTLQPLPATPSKDELKSITFTNKRLTRDYKNALYEYEKAVKKHDRAMTKERSKSEPESLQPLSPAACSPPQSPQVTDPVLDEDEQKIPKKLRRDSEKEQRDKEKEKEKERRDREKEQRDREKEKEKERRDKEKEKEKERRDREKEQRDREKEKEKERRDKEKEKEKERKDKEKEKRKKGKEKEKQPRQRKFCITPSPPDSLWTPVEMEGVDEVGAHCGLFFVGETYSRLLGDVAGKIEEWVGEVKSARLVQESGNGDYKLRLGSTGGWEGGARWEYQGKGDEYGGGEKGEGG